MKKGVKIIGRNGKNNRVTHFEYKGIEYWTLASEFEKMTDSDFDKLHQNSMNEKRKWDKVGKRIEKERAAMTPEERAGWDEADRAVFERWQDEANTNAILDGYEPEEGEDSDFNPFRKDNDE